MAQLQSLDAESFGAVSNEAPSRQPSKRSAHLDEAKELIVSGELRLAVDLLLRHEDTQPGPMQRAEAALLLAQSYARLGLQIDATEWLVQAQRRSAQAKTQSAYDAAHVAVLHWFGHEVNAIRIANTILGRQSRRATDPERMHLLSVLGSAYLRLGQVGKAQRCAEAMLESGYGIGGRWAGFALIGEIKLWSVVRQHPAFMAEVLSSDDMTSRPPPPGRLISDAMDAYAEAREAAPIGSVARRHAEIGLARAGAAGRPDSSDWSRLEANIAWLNARGLCQERDIARLQLGELLLLHHRSLDARRWLIPLADAALAKPGVALEHDALYFASVACSESGNDRAALIYLNRYNVRIREQHLSRITLPPPNLERLPEVAAPRTRGRRRDESGREVVAFVVAQVRLAPQARLDYRQFAQQAGVSRRTLENDFRRVTGLPPKEFMTRLRLLAFERRLAEIEFPDAPLLERLARELGFRNYRSLIRCAGRVAPIDADRAAFLLSVLD